MRLLSRYRFRHFVKRCAFLSIDALGALVLAFKHRPEINLAHPPEKILAIRLDHLGDVVMVRPALKLLKQWFPKSRLSVLISDDLAAFLEKDSFVDEIIPVSNHWFKRDQQKIQWGREAKTLASELRAQNFDLAIDFRGDFRNILLMHDAKIPIRVGYTGTGGGFLLTHPQNDIPGIHQVVHNIKLLEVLKITTDGNNPKLPPISVDRQKAQCFENQYSEYLGSQLIKIILHPSAGYPSKKWPADRWLALTEALLKESRVRLIILGTEVEKKEITFPASPHLLDLRGKTNLEEMATLFSNGDFFIGQDSGPSHIAAAQGIPGVILFSGTNESKVWRPWSDKLSILEHAVACSPCEAQICPLRHHSCMNEITLAQVLEEVMNFVQKSMTRR